MSIKLTKTDKKPEFALEKAIQKETVRTEKH